MCFIAVVSSFYRSMSVASSAPPPFTSTSPVSPHLYQDALMSVLRFLDLADLVPVLAVSREWRSSVLHLPPIHSTMLWDNDHGTLAFERYRSDELTPDEASRARLAFGLLSSNSPLLKHIASLHLYAKKNLLTVAVSSSLTHLRTLSFVLSEVAPDQPSFAHNLVFPAGLTFLYLEFASRYMMHVELETFPLLRSCTRLRTMELDIRDYDAALPLHLLGATELPSLRSLSMRVHCWFRCSINRRHLQAFGTYTQLDHFVAMGQMSSVLVPALLNSGSKLRWQSVTTEDDAAWIMQPDCLQYLPTLTALHTQWEGPDLAWLKSLPLLRTLALGFGTAEDEFRDPVLLVTGLQACPQITSLAFAERCPFESKHLAAIVEAMHELAELRLTELRSLHSLDFLAAGKLHTTLRLLYLQGMSLPASEESHLRGLRALHRLDVGTALAIDKQTKKAYAVPSSLFPLLESVNV